MRRQTWGGGGVRGCAQNCTVAEGIEAKGCRSEYRGELSGHCNELSGRCSEKQVVWAVNERQLLGAVQ